MREKTIVETSEAPSAIGPYSQAVVVGELVFLSGQIALDPESGEMVGGDMEARTTRVMENMRAVLAAVGLSFDHLVRTTIFLKDMDDFEVVNRVYGGYFDNAPPARATVEVARLPKNARVEIDGIAVIPDDDDEADADDAA